MSQAMAISLQRNITPLSFLDRSTETWTIHVKVLKKFCVRSSNPNQNDSTVIARMILIDKENGKIQASYSEKDTSRNHRVIHEDQVYEIKNFHVVENYDIQKYSNHKYKIVFHSNTSVRRLDDRIIPDTAYNFTRYEDIILRRLDEQISVDVIGLISSKNDTVFPTPGSAQKPFKTLTIRDFRGLSLDIVLFGEYIDQVEQFISTSTGAQFLIIQFAKLSYYEGTPYISTNTGMTKTIFNKNCSDILRLRMRLRHDTLQESLPWHIRDVHGLQTDDKVFHYHNKRKYIAELHQLGKGDYAIMATIVKIRTSRDWFYSVCGVCNDSLIRSETGQFFCFYCRAEVDNVTTRFKVVYKVKDDSGTSSFMLLSRELGWFLDIDADTLREDILEQDVGLIQVGDKRCVLFGFDEYCEGNNGFNVRVPEELDGFDALSCENGLVLMKGFDHNDKTIIKLWNSTINKPYTLLRCSLGVLSMGFGFTTFDEDYKVLMVLNPCDIGRGGSRIPI